MTPELPQKLIDRIFALGTKEENFEQILTRIVKNIENKSKGTIPDTFEDYWQLEKYFNKIGFVQKHLVSPENDSVSVKVIGEDGLSAFDLHYKKLKDGKFTRCSHNERFNVESSELHT